MAPSSARVSSSRWRALVVNRHADEMVPRFDLGDWICRLGYSERRADTPTHVSTTEPIDSTYRPALRVAPRYTDHFRPTMLTNPDGALSPQVAADVEALREVQPRSRLPGAAGG